MLQGKLPALGIRLLGDMPFASVLDHGKHIKLQLKASSNEVELKQDNVDQRFVLPD